MSIVDGAIIGEGTSVGPFSIIENGVVIGNNCEIQSSVALSYGVEVGNNVFIGSGSKLTNTRKPVANEPNATSCVGKIRINDNVSIGANVTIICGTNERPLEIGKGATIGAGSVITKSVPQFVTVVGNPAGILVKDILGNTFVINFEQYFIKKIR